MLAYDIIYLEGGNMLNIEKRVEEILNSFEIFSAPIPIVNIAKAYGFIVVEINLDEPGFMIIDNQGIEVNGKTEKRIIAVNNLDSPFRKRFTIAHELGHYFLEVYGKAENENYFFHRELKSSETDYKKEKEADLFASELLVPTRILKKELEKLKTIDIIFYDIPNIISRMFNVSLQCAEIRYERYKKQK